MIDDTVISLPYPDLASVTFNSGEDINFSTINSKLVKLLENDKAIYQLKEDIYNTAIKNYATLIKLKKPSEISETDLIWLEDNDDGELTYPNVYNKKHINILAPIIPYNTKLTSIDKPTGIPPGISTINETIHEALENISSPLHTYDYILKQVYDKHLELSSTGNVVRYDAMYFASLNRHQYYSDLYKAGYRWGEILMTEEALYNLSAITKNIKSPITRLQNFDNNFISNIPNTYGIVTNTSANQYVLDNSGQQLMNSYTSGQWSRKIGNSLLTVGGVYQITPESMDISNIRIEFPTPFYKCINVIANTYNSTNAISAVNNPNTLYTCPITVLKIDNTGFNIKLNPDYSGTNKTLAEFNIIWKAEGILND